MAVNEDTDRKPSKVTERAVGQTAVGALNALVGNYLLTQGWDPTMVVNMAVIGQVAFTLFGKVLRNVANEKGWLKYFA